MRTLSRPELTAALAARQGLLERGRMAPAEAIRRFTPLQGQEPRAPCLALAARLDGFARADLQAAIAAGEVVKTSIMRRTLHLVAADEYPSYVQLVRRSRSRDGVAVASGVHGRAGERQRLHRGEGPSGGRGGVADSSRYARPRRHTAARTAARLASTR